MSEQIKIGPYTILLWSIPPRNKWFSITIYYRFLNKKKEWETKNLLSISFNEHGNLRYIKTDLIGFL